MSEKMYRFNEGKPTISLVPTAFLNAIYGSQLFNGPQKLVIDVAHVLDFGSRKYAANNWRRGGSWLKVLDSGLRHLLAFQRGETHDPESGLHHLAHLGCNLAFLAEFVDEETSEDDRYRTGPRTPPNAQGVEWVAQLLIAWRDGAPHSYLHKAIATLAAIYEGLDESNGSPSMPLFYSTNLPQGAALQ